MTRELSRSVRIEAWIAPETLAVVRRTAEMQGRSVSDFVVAAASEAAQKAIEDANTIRLSIDEQRRFVDLLLNPAPLSPAVKRARKAHSRLIRESR